MYINGDYFREDDLVASPKSFLKKYKNIYVSEEQKNILDKYDIDVNKYNNIDELIYDIEEYLNSSIQELEDLEWVSQMVSEYNYYNNTNK